MVQIDLFILLLLSFIFSNSGFCFRPMLSFLHHTCSHSGGYQWHGCNKSNMKYHGKTGSTREMCNGQLPSRNNPKALRINTRNELELAVLSFSWVRLGFSQSLCTYHAAEKVNDLIYIQGDGRLTAKPSAALDPTNSSKEFSPTFLLFWKAGLPKMKRQFLLALLQPLRWRCVDCVIHHERDVREE